MSLSTRAKVAAIATSTALSAAAVLTVSPTAAAPEPAPDALAGLQVLLTNDDSPQARDTRYGTDGKGLYELRRALCAAGADVLVVAPWAQQSGSGGQITPPGFHPIPFTVAPAAVPSQYAEDCDDAPSGGAVFGVCIAEAECTADSPSATPADAVNVALSRFAATYWPDGPDLVFSGTNFGQNVGAMVNHSGTVGAAVTAGEYGVPAIALSAEVPHNLALLDQVPFAEAAATGVRVATSLVERDLLTPGLLLNVNQPFVGDGEQLGEPVAAVIGTSMSPSLNFLGEVDATGGTYQLVPASGTAESRADSDTAALARNDIPITALDGDWGVPRQKKELTTLLKALQD